MIWRLLGVVAIVVASAAGGAAQTPVSDPRQLEDLISDLRADRANYALLIDTLRVQIRQQERAAAEHDAAVDRYWRAYTGLDKPKK